MRAIYFPLLLAIVALSACGQNASGQDSKDEGANAQPADNQAVAVPSFQAITGVYKPDFKHRYIVYTYDHKGLSHPQVRWRQWDATLNWNAENPEASSVDVTIETASIDSGVDMFDGHLQGESFFDAANHPEITFKSTGVEITGENTGKVAGDLTIKGITRPVTLDVTFNGDFAREGSYALGFSGKTTVSRSDFDMAKLVPVVGDEVTVIIEAEFEMNENQE